jgi:hypothetical protein
MQCRLPNKRHARSAPLQTRPADRRVSRGRRAFRASETTRLPARRTPSSLLEMSVAGVRPCYAQGARQVTGCVLAHAVFL